MNIWRTLSLGLLLLAESAGRNLALARDGAGGSRDCVILIHGLGRTSWSMKGLAWSLNREGYRVINASYPSTRIPVQAAADDWLASLVSGTEAMQAGKIHFVTHSLGGIILRQYLSEHRLENLGRVVMLAPPNRGSELVDRLRHNPVYRWATGPAGQELGTESSSVPNRLGSPRFELGVIAGDRSLNPRFSSLIPGPDDGKVSVYSTTLPGMKDFLVIHHSHTWMMWKREVTGAVARFLKQGCFGEVCRQTSMGPAQPRD